MNVYPFDGIISVLPLNEIEIDKIKKLIVKLKNVINKNYGGIIKRIIIAPKGTYCPHKCPYCFQSRIKEKERLLDVNTLKLRLHEINEKYNLIDDLQIEFCGGTIDDTDLRPYIDVVTSFFKDKKLNFIFLFDLLYKNIDVPISTLKYVNDYQTIAYITIDAGAETRISNYGVKKEELLNRLLYLIKMFPDVKFTARSNISQLTQPSKIVSDIKRFLDYKPLLIFTTVKHMLAPTPQKIDNVVNTLSTYFNLTTSDNNEIAINPRKYAKKLIRLSENVYIYNILTNQCPIRYKSMISIGPDFVSPCIIHNFRVKSLDNLQYPNYPYTYKDKVSMIHECVYTERFYPGYKYPGHDRFTYHFMNIIAKNLEDGLPIWIDINDIFNTEKYYQI